MTKRVVFKFEHGNFTDGFSVSVRIEEENQQIEIEGIFPPAPNLQDLYQRWDSDYSALGNLRLGNFKKVHNPAPMDYTQLIKSCQQLSTELLDCFKDWLQNSTESGFQNFRSELCTELGQGDARIQLKIPAKIREKSPQLEKLPWHLWELTKRAKIGVEVALAPTQSRLINAVERDKTKVRILAIFGADDGIDINSDKTLLDELKAKGAEITSLIEPKKSEISNQLWDQNWDILFFAGHSSSQGEQGLLSINRNESLTIAELALGLTRAIDNGLQLAIFNSCDGLKLAWDLADLNIPQVIVMREPVPDKVAQTFLKFFLAEFSKGAELYLAVRHARQRLFETCEKEYPSASWLPIIYQNPNAEPFFWPKVEEAIVLPPKEIPINPDNDLIKAHKLFGQIVDVSVANFGTRR